MIKETKYLVLFLPTLVLSVNSFPQNYSAENLKTLQNALHESSLYMTNEVKNEHVAICIGGTKSGKSTLINYLIGNKLIGVKRHYFHPVTIEKADNSSGPEIGKGITSETKIPTRWVSTYLSELAIWDAPGFDDNRGSLQDITNAFYLYQLLQNVKSLKIILVVDANDILNDNMKPFLSVLEAVKNLLGDKMSECFSSISVIFTKVPHVVDEVAVDIPYLKERLKQVLVNNWDINVHITIRGFVNFFIVEDNHIALFKKAKLGPVTKAIDVNIFQAINSSKQIDKNVLKDVRPSISDTSKLLLFNSREELLSKTAFGELKRILNELAKKLENYLNQAGNEDYKLKNLNEILKLLQMHLLPAVSPMTSFSKKLIILQSIDGDINKSIHENNLFEKVTLMDFVDKLLNLEESKQLSLQMDVIILSYITKVNEVMSSVELKLGKITQQRYEEQLRAEQNRHKEVMRILMKKLAEVEEKNNERESFFSVLANAVGTVVQAIVFARLFKKV